MGALDLPYVARLVREAQAGDSNAFAELFAATYQSQYHFALKFLKDPGMAQDALQQTYVAAIRSIHQVRDPMLIVAWLNQISFRICYRLQYEYSHLNDTGAAAAGLLSLMNETIRIDNSTYTIRRISDLPFTESQVILLKYFRRMKTGQIAQLLQMSRSSVRHYLNNGIRRLKQLPSVTT